MSEEQLWEYLETVEGKNKLLKIINSNIKEIERLNNIINELEKYLIEYSQDLEYRCYANMFLDKLAELKGSDKE